MFMAKRSVFPRRQRGRRTRPFWPVVQPLEDRLMLTGPTANPGYYMTGAGQVLDSTTWATASVLTFDTDTSGLALTAQVAANPLHGTLVLNSGGSFVYAPNPGFTGLDRFQYEAYDGSSSSNPSPVYVFVGAQTEITQLTPLTPPSAAEGSATPGANPLLHFTIGSGTTVND